MAKLVASFFGTGLLLRRLRAGDAGSGTVGGLAALVISLVIPPWWGRIVAALVAVGLGWWAVRAVLAALPPNDTGKSADPGWVVVDEAAGTFAATIGLGWPAALVAFVVFRIADIAKKAAPGVAQAERLPGAAGVMADDLVAAAYGLTAGWIVQLIIG
jgi:phosphatidylglycerophosphatase A